MYEGTNVFFFRRGEEGVGEKNDLIIHVSGNPSHICLVRVGTQVEVVLRSPFTDRRILLRRDFFLLFGVHKGTLTPSPV